MGIEAPAEVKYGLIREAVSQDNNLLNISCLCRLAGVSRSGYYAWLDAAPQRQVREDRDAADFDKVLEAFQYRYPKGARGIYMRLLHTGERMNLKKIRRLMKKYGLKCPFRKPNPYKQLARALKTSTVAPNVVNRDFTSRGVRKVLLTDITYLFYAGGRCYLSTILDAVTHEVLAWQVSESLEVQFVLVTVEELLQKHGAELDNTTIVHSDQGCHYTSRAFIEKLKDAAFMQSMSRKGNCWDNAPQESFFGHMKDEIACLIAAYETFQEVQYRLMDWMDYYNNERYQWGLLKLAPMQYYRYKTTGYYPLPQYQPHRTTNLRGSAPVPEV